MIMSNEQELCLKGNLTYTFHIPMEYWIWFVIMQIMQPFRNSHDLCSI